MCNSLVDFRVEAELTQKQMSEKIGVSLTFYSKIETGLRNPSYSFLIKLKKAFPNVCLDKIFFNNIKHSECSA